MSKFSHDAEDDDDAAADEARVWQYLDVFFKKQPS